MRWPRLLDLHARRTSALLNKSALMGHVGNDWICQRSDPFDINFDCIGGL
jgi:hypothetical protein